MRTRGKALIVLILGLGTALAMAFSGRDSGEIPDVAGVAEKKASSANPSATDPHERLRSEINFDLSAVKRIAPEHIQSSGLFQSKSWYVAPPPPPPNPASLLPPPPPPPPTAPQLPFTFIGRMIDGDDVTLFLTNNNNQYNAKLNDVLDSTYRVDKITDKSAVLTYLPLNIQQELVFNSTAVGISSLSASASVMTIQTPAQPPAPLQQQIEISR